MRCRECNVDLSESYKRCPLCSGEAFDDEARVKGIKAAPYPNNVPVKKAEKIKKPKTAFTFEKIKAFFNL